jgi:hypothetical protein
MKQIVVASTLLAATAFMASAKPPKENLHMDPKHFPIFDVLAASESHPDLRAVNKLFGQFIGRWTLDIRFFDEKGTEVYHGPGLWCFAWVLDGRGIQDVITYAPLDNPRENGPGRRRIGTTVRVYDQKRGCWRIVWMGASSGTFLSLLGRAQGQDILVEGEEDDGALLRWTFTEITPKRFRWTGRISLDQGRTWRVEQEMVALRE